MSALGALQGKRGEMSDYIILAVFLLGLTYILLVLEPKSKAENLAMLLHELTEMIKVVDNSNLSEEDKSKIKGNIAEISKEIFTDKGGEDK